MMAKRAFVLVAVFAISLVLLVPHGVAADDGEVVAAGFTSTLPASGVALTSWDGGSVGTIAAEYPSVKSVWVSISGELVGYVVGAPDFANGAFLGLYPGGDVAAGTVMIVVAVAGSNSTAPPPPQPTVAAPPEVGVVPSSLGLDPFYSKYVDADGIPVVSSSLVPDEALLEARRIVIGMLGGIPDTRDAIIASGVRIAIMAKSEVTTDIPEHSDLYEAFPGVDWDTRSRGLGATTARPATSGAEENLLCYANDVYRGENTLVHELAHTLFEFGVASLPGGSGYQIRLDQAFADALSDGRWINTYAATNSKEYWAEAVQSWFNTNIEAIPTNGIHNHVNTRDELWEYDPAIAELIEELLPTTWLPVCPE